MPAHDLRREAQAALRASVGSTTQLQLIDEDCVGGTYFALDGGRRVGVFKPAREEAALPENPKRPADGASDTDPPKRGFLPGRGYLREVAAYLLDHEGFAGVPCTTTCTLRTRGVAMEGSLQAFVEAPKGQSWDHGPGRFCAADARRIALLDMRLLNCDRHGGNILVGDAGRLTPIDHGYCLPCATLEDLDFEWLCWPQARTPFTAEECDYVARLDADADAAVLRSLGVEDAAVEVMRAGTLALQAGVALGLNAMQLGEFFRRQTIGTPSRLEECIDASRTARTASQEDGSSSEDGDASLVSTSASFMNPEPIDFRVFASELATALAEYAESLE